MTESAIINKLQTRMRIIIAGFIISALLGFGIFGFMIYYIFTLNSRLNDQTASNQAQTTSTSSNPPTNENETKQNESSNQPETGNSPTNSEIINGLQDLEKSLNDSSLDLGNPEADF